MPASVPRIVAAIGSAALVLLAVPALAQTNPRADDLRRATNASPVLAREAPESVAALLNYPKSQPAKATEQFVWVNFEIDGQPTIALTHRLVTPQDDGTLVLADRHYYVSRSHNAVQAIAGLFPVQEGALVIYANRTFTDQLGGFGASAKQAIGRKIMAGRSPPSMSSSVPDRSGEPVR